jgi:hypothetical protein
MKAAEATPHDDRYRVLTAATTDRSLPLRTTRTTRGVIATRDDLSGLKTRCDMGKHYQDTDYAAVACAREY